MPSNWSVSIVHFWAGAYPGSVGHLYSPGAQRGPYPWLPYALDNGAFAGFDEGAWVALLRWAALSGQAPLWVVVPDVVGDRDGTLERWEQYAPVAAKFGWPLAFVAQDGMAFEDVPEDAEVVFIGGTTDWKLAALRPWCERFSRVHVGRVNTLDRLLLCHRAGAESCDGTGWGRGDKQQLNGLIRYMEMTHGNDDTLGSRLV